MAAIESYIRQCESIADDKRAGEHHSRALRLACEEAWTARAKLSDQRTQLRIAALALERTLDTGLPLASHGFNDSHYSKVTSACAAIGYRTAIHKLQEARSRFDSAIAEYQSAVLRYRESV